MLHQWIHDEGQSLTSSIKNKSRHTHLVFKASACLHNLRAMLPLLSCSSAWNTLPPKTSMANLCPVTFLKCPHLKLSFPSPFFLKWEASSPRSSYPTPLPICSTHPPLTFSWLLICYACLPQACSLPECKHHKGRGLCLVH